MASRRKRRRFDDAEKRRAFDELYESTFDQILAYCRRRSLRAEDAEDAVSETYLTAWRRIEEARGAESPRSWLYGVAFRVTANQRRGRDRFRRLIDRLTQIPHRSVVDSAEDVALTAASADVVYAALATLTPMEQELIRLSALEGFRHVEIGAIVGLSAPAVRTRLYRARQRLKARLDDDGRRDIAERPDTSNDEGSVHEPPARSDGQADEEEQR